MRVLNGARAAIGLVEIVAPQRALSVLGTPAADGLEQTVVRVLGTRQLLQALLAEVRPSSRMHRFGAAVDVAHALTMLALAARDHRYRAPASASAAIAIVLSGLELPRGRKPVRRRPG